MLLKKVVGFSEVPLAICQPSAGDTDPSEWYQRPSFRELRPNAHYSFSSTKAMFAPSCLALQLHCPKRHSISKLLSTSVCFPLEEGREKKGFVMPFNVTDSLLDSNSASSVIIKLPPGTHKGENLFPMVSTAQSRLQTVRAALERAL